MIKCTIKCIWVLEFWSDNWIQLQSSAKALGHLADIIKEIMRLAQTEQLVSQLKELIREKDAALRSKDDQLRVSTAALWSLFWFISLTVIFMIKSQFRPNLTHFFQMRLLLLAINSTYKQHVPTFDSSIPFYKTVFVYYLNQSALYISKCHNTQAKPTQINRWKTQNMLTLKSKSAIQQ